MNRFLPRFLGFPLVLSGALTVPALLPEKAQAQAQQMDEVELARAQQAEDAGQLQQAAELYAKFEQGFPTSIRLPQAVLRLGYVYFRLGEWDKAVEKLEATTKLPNVTPDLKELALSLIPKVISAKASTMKPEEPARKTTFEDAIKRFDDFLKAYPKSTEFESANYGKGLSLFQLARYDEAAQTLDLNLKSFPQSETVMDSRYLFALTRAQQANQLAEKSEGKDPNLSKAFATAENELQAVAKGPDVNLANDAQFQAGLLLFSRANFIPPGDKAREATYQKALEALRQVRGKAEVVERQNQLIAYIKARRVQAFQARQLDLASKTLPRILDRETEKLSAIEGRPDQTVLARLKSGEIFFHLEHYDEARVLLNAVKDAVAPEEKKEVAYFTALSLGSQTAKVVDQVINVEKQKGTPDEEALAAAKTAANGLAERTASAYADFKSEYKADPIAENLALIVGLGFARIDPEKSLTYFKDSVTDFPKGKFRTLALAQEAAALLTLKKYDEAVKGYQAVLAEKPEKPIAAEAEYGIAMASYQARNYPEAIAGFKKVRDNYPDQAPAENASFLYGQLLGQTGQSAQAVTELDAFLQKFPKSEMRPQAIFYKGAAQMAVGRPKPAAEQEADFKAAGETLAELAKPEYAKLEVAPLAMKTRGDMFLIRKDYDGVIKVMEELQKTYPDWKDIYQAYDLKGQLHGVKKETKEQIETYLAYANSKPKEDPNVPVALLKVAGLYKKQADDLGRFVGLPEEKRKLWLEAVDKSMETVTKLIHDCPRSPEVASGIAFMTDLVKMQQQGKGVSGAKEVAAAQAAALQKLAGELEQKGESAAASKVKFVQAADAFAHAQDKAAALDALSKAYLPGEKYAPADMDVYGQALLLAHKYEEAQKVYEKLATDYPVPAAGNPSPEVQEAQATSLFGRGKVLQEQAKVVEAEKLFKQLETQYPWSPKRMEASYGMALAAYREKKYDAAMDRVTPIITAREGTTELKGRAMLLLAQCHEDQQRWAPAIDNYMQVVNRYMEAENQTPALREAVAEALWRGANLLERQASGEIAMPTPVPKAAPKKK